MSRDVRRCVYLWCRGKRRGTFCISYGRLSGTGSFRRVRCSRELPRANQAPFPPGESEHGTPSLKQARPCSGTTCRNRKLAKPDRDYPGQSSGAGNCRRGVSPVVKCPISHSYSAFSCLRWLTSGSVLLRPLKVHSMMWTMCGVMWSRAFQPCEERSL